ncbi:MAG: endonuclease MutS2 [Christensenellales bacterium]|jgi:DNA mismatch repair protein MutS2
MDQNALRVLEYPKIIDKLCENTRSDMGRELAAALLPSGDVSQVRSALRETDEAESYLYRLGSNPVPGFTDVRGLLKRAAAGAVLGMGQLLLCAQVLHASRTLKEQLDKPQTDEHGNPLPAGVIRSLAQLLFTEPEVERAITDSILGEDEMSDNASGRLAEIRRKKRQCADRVKEKLNSLIRSSTTQKYLQDAYISVRGGRYVLPVKAENRGAIPGLIHDQSSSGATLFIEPMAVVEINNDLRRLEAEEREEMDRILGLLSAQLGEVEPSLSENLELMAKLDFIFAKGVLSRQMRAIAPELTDNMSLRLVRARHPLLDPAKVVPLDLWLGEEFTQLIITGPNTGGKTVSLKTVGLLSAMTQAGLHIPAALGSRMAVFEQIFADIGDEQSIEQSLSTFSSHMTNIVAIVDQADADSLILLDELGAGTDPAEGAALAMEILEELRRAGARTMATTHYSELKAYALTTPQVENASMEFDVASLRPTYRLSVGIPGKSNAFEISEKLGLPERIIERSRQRLSQDTIRFEEVLSSAEAQRQVALRERELAEEARREMIALRDEADQLKAQMAAQREKLQRQAREEAKRVLLQAREQTEQLIKQIKQAQKEAGHDPAMEAARAARRQIESSLGKVQQAPKEPERPLGEPLEEVSPGQTVFVASLDREAVALTGASGKGQVQVQAGSMKLNVKLSDLRRAAQPKKAAPERSRTKIAPRQAALEVDIRGMDVETGILEVDRYLDDAVLSGLKTVQIIHGKGTGVLRAGIHQHLKRHPQVASYRLGAFGEGESGVTVVELK